MFKIKTLVEDNKNIMLDILIGLFCLGNEYSSYANCCYLLEKSKLQQFKRTKSGVVVLQYLTNILTIK